MAQRNKAGPIAALMNEYEKALNEFKVISSNIPDKKFRSILNNRVHKDFGSVRNITLHVIDSGYQYANYIRKRFNKKTTDTKYKINNSREAGNQINQMFQYTLKTFEGKWDLTDGEMINILIKTSWNTYGLEAIIEHAIVHILRHRRQVENLIKNKF